MSTNTRRYTDRMQFAAYMDFSFITFLHGSVGSIFYHFIYGCMFCMIVLNLVNYVILLLCQCIFIFIFMYSYCYVWSGNACYHSLQNLLSSRFLSKHLKVKIYRTIILPVVLYGCETWSLTLRDEKEAEGV